MLFLASCAVTRTSSPDVTAPQVFNLTAEQAESVLASAMAAEFPGKPIGRVELPARGYKVDLQFVLDRHVIAAYALPATGGTIFQVDSQGTMILQGEARASALFKRILRDARAAEGQVAATK
jgi:hypothetical protein